MNYRKKLRSSDNHSPDDFVNRNSHFMDDLNRKAEESAMNNSDENASLYKSQNHVDISVNEPNVPFEIGHLTMVDVLANDSTFELFKSEISEQTEIGMAVGVQKFELQSQMIGGTFFKSETPYENNKEFIFDGTFYVDCICFCFNLNRVFYMNLQKGQSTLQKIKQFLSSFIRRNDLKLKMFEAKEHLKVIKKAFDFVTNMAVKISDPRLGSWLIDPNTNFTLKEMLQKFLPENLHILELSSNHNSVNSLALSYGSKVEPKIRAAVESFLSLALIKKQIEVMKITGNGLLARVFVDLEMPIQVVLMKMELTGFPINEDKFQETIKEATMIQRQLEQHIYELNGKRFNLSSSKEVSKAIEIHRDIENKKVSTAKSVLKGLEHPIAMAIMTWRTLSKTLSNMQTMVKIIKNGRVYSNSFSLTQTGRISMYEPNLQNVTKDFDVAYKSVKSTISFRRVFQCSKGKILLCADFCQLELRILTHLCKDSSLIKIMNSPGEDIFKRIAAKWNNIDESKVNSEQRNQTKQLCYGIIYGMGNKSLAETMNIDEEIAVKLAEDFHSAYPQLRIFKDKLVQKTREQGFVETVTGRRRYFPTIKSSNMKEKSQAERQALNTCVQGSASDLVKNAMLRMDRNIRRQNLEGCELVLHLHDELFYEVPEQKLRQAAKILTYSMQNCVKLAVPLLVKLKAGTSWGDMKELIQEDE